MQKQPKHSFCRKNLQLLVLEISHEGGIEISKKGLALQCTVWGKFSYSFSCQSSAFIIFVPLPAYLHSSIPNPTIHALSIHSAVNQHTHLILLLPSLTLFYILSLLLCLFCPHALVSILSYNTNP